MRFFKNQAEREAHPVSVHEINFPELFVDTDTRSFWRAKSAGAASADRWERLSGPLQDIPDAPTSADGGYVSEDFTLYHHGRWTVDRRKLVDGRVVFLRDTNLPPTVKRIVVVNSTWTIPADEQLVMVGPLTLNGRLVCNGNLAFA